MSGRIKTDRRIIKTKKAIRNALAELLSQKDIGEISIKDIADRAEINRKTFYSYYRGVYEVIDEIENEIVSAFKEALRDMDFKRDMHDPYGIFKKLTAIINSDMDFYGHLMQINHNVSLVSKIIQTLKLDFKRSLSHQIDIDEKTLDLTVDYSVAGMVTVYQSWFNSGKAQSFEEISKAVSVIAFSGINGLISEGV